MELKPQNLFLQAYRKHYLKKYDMVWNRMQKNVPFVKQNVMKLEVLRIDQKKKKGGGEGEERG